jgi:hypothetical protein
MHIGCISACIFSHNLKFEASSFISISLIAYFLEQILFKIYFKGKMKSLPGGSIAMTIQHTDTHITHNTHITHKITELKHQTRKKQANKQIKFVFLVYDNMRVLAVLSLMEFAVHQSLTELMSDGSKRQSFVALITRKILRASANIRNLQ